MKLIIFSLMCFILGISWIIIFMSVYYNKRSGPVFFLITLPGSLFVAIAVTLWIIIYEKNECIFDNFLFLESFKPQLVLKDNPQNPQWLVTVNNDKASLEEKDEESLEYENKHTIFSTQEFTNFYETSEPLRQNGIILEELVGYERIP